MSASLPHSIAGLNQLPQPEKRRRYAEVLPAALLERFSLDAARLTDGRTRALFSLTASPGTSSAELDLRPAAGAPDPLFYGHFADTMNGQIIILLAVVNDPAAPRFDVDRLPDGTKTKFGTAARNLPAEEAALAAGLAPGQVRRGLRALPELIQSFETFVTRLGHALYFTEPLAYHNAVVFERYGFAYQQGRRWMESIHTRFSPGGDLFARLDGSTPFRRADFARHIRGRSWAIHDGLMGEPFTGVHMYKTIGQRASVSTFPDGEW
jgi:acetoin utilization protein AcuC